MGNVILKIIRISTLFGRNAIGCINDPYITYRKLTQERSAVSQTVIITIFVILYFFFVSLARGGLEHPLVLTLKFNILLLTSLSGFFGMIGLIYILGKILGNSGKIKSIYVLWSYSLIPTLVWFIITSLLYLLIPPPRTLSITGKVFSVVFIAFSLAVLLWKLILFYLTVRFSLKADLKKILLITIIILPLVIIYTLISYQLKIFRIPFI